MKKKYLYLLLSIIILVCFFSLAASCNMCGLSFARETVEEVEEETGDESASAADEEDSDGYGESQESLRTDTQTENIDDTIAEDEDEEADGEEEANHNPVITNVIADDAELDLSDEFRILTGVTADFIIEAEDEDGDRLSYFVSDSNDNNMETAELDNNTAEFGWVAPDDPGLYEIYIEVSDDNGGEALATVRVTVNPWEVVEEDDDEGEVFDARRVRGIGAVASLSGQVNENREVFLASDSSGTPYIYVGDLYVPATDSHLKARGFLSFDISVIEGDNVAETWLNVSGSTVGDPTTLMCAMAIASTNYGDSLTGSDYTSSASTLTSVFPLDHNDFSFTNSSLRNAVQSALDADRQYFQVKFYITTANGNHNADGFTIYLSDVMLEVEYN